MTVSENVILNVASLLNQDASVYEVEDEGLLLPDEASLKLAGFDVSEPIEWYLIVRGTGGDDDFILEGRVTGKALMECRRCLDSVAGDIAYSFVYPMIYKMGTEGLKLIESDDEEGDLLIFGKPEIDFTDLIVQLFAIEMPITALCREDCKGLSVTGVNLNDHPEAAVTEVVVEKESPFAVLKDIKLDA